MRIAVWADGQWCNVGDTDAFRSLNGLNDDYSVHFAASDAQAEEIAQRVARYNYVEKR